VAVVNMTKRAKSPIVLAPRDVIAANPLEIDWLMAWIVFIVG
jgi:hypothetical protein